MLEELKKDVTRFSDKEKGKFLQRFFKTGTGEYAEGDIFAGLTVPQSRQISKKYSSLPRNEVQKLLSSPIHEERLIALFILVEQFKNGNDQTKKEIYDLYLKNTQNINNWDLVDSSAHKIVGEYILDKDINVLKKLAHSPLVWERRIAIIATFAFIRVGRSDETLQIARLLLHDTHDLIHKAVGWALREVALRVSQEEVEVILEEHRKTMPRTMLRYAIEKFPSEKKSYYMKK